MAKAAALAEELRCATAASPADAASGADLILTSLADDRAVLDVYLGQNGISRGAAAGSLAIDTSTVDPATIEEVGAALEASGIAFIDCPVSGSVSTVEAGMLTIMAGGEAEDVDRARPLLDAISKQVFHVGERGAGAATKLAVNGLLHGLNIALSEALVLAERAGVDRGTAYEVFSSGAAGAPFLDYKRQSFNNPEDTPVAFSLDLVAKDLELIAQLGKRVGAPMAQAEKGLDIVRAALEAGMADEDLSAVAVYLRRLAG
jgi:3-hydroxyisobutyrate dehydrogenase/2-hydroxy-3-oxopropionate reductase